MSKSIIPQLQDALYSKFNDFSSSFLIRGRFFAIPVALGDVLLDTVSAPLFAIVSIATAAINLIGIPFSKAYTLKNVLLYTEAAFRYSAITPIKCALAPFKIVFQSGAILVDPTTVQSINFKYPTFKQVKESAK